MTDDQKQALLVIADQARRVAGLIHQRDQRPPRDFQTEPPRAMLRTHGPDVDLQNIEVQLQDVATAIDACLRQHAN